MATEQLQEGLPGMPAAIYRVALALDAFLLNGIPCGAIHRDVCSGFVEKTAGNLLRELASLEQQASQSSHADQQQITEALAALRARCQQLIDLVTALSSFRTLPPEQLRAMVRQVPAVREVCVQLIQQLEACVQSPKPFYQSRPSHATAAVSDFLAGLETLFTQERGAS